MSESNVTGSLYEGEGHVKRNLSSVRDGMVRIRRKTHLSRIPAPIRPSVPPSGPLPGPAHGNVHARPTPPTLHPPHPESLPCPDCRHTAPVPLSLPHTQHRTSVAVIRFACRSACDMSVRRRLPGWQVQPGRVRAVTGWPGICARAGRYCVTRAHRALRRMPGVPVSVRQRAPHRDDGDVACSGTD